MKFSKNSDGYNPILLDSEDQTILNILYNTIHSNGFGASIDYQALKDFCNEYKLNVIEIFQICRVLLYELTKEDT